MSYVLPEGIFLSHLGHMSGEVLPVLLILDYISAFRHP